ncbi:MAG: cell division protein FtsA [bacterium]
MSKIPKPECYNPAVIPAAIERITQPLKPALITGIDVGTTKTVTIIAQVSPDVGLELLGIGQYPSTGLRKGLVVDLDRTIAAIEESLAAAERMAGERVHSAVIGVTGAHLRSHPAQGSVAVSNPDRGVSSDDIHRLMQLVKAQDFGQGRRHLATLVREYVLDGEGGLRNPRGRSALKLEMHGLLVSGDVNSLDQLHRAATAARLTVQDMFLQPVASGEAVLTLDEMEQGTVLVDIGGGTSDVAVYLDGAVIYTYVIPVGGDHFDSDAAYAFELDPAHAEWVKVHHGSVRASAFASAIVARLPFPSAKQGVVPEKLLAEVLRPRAEELADLIRAELVATNLLYHLKGGCVLTGGGSQLDGLAELVQTKLELPTRIGRPYGIAGRKEDLQSPSLATVVGLVKLAARDAEAAHPSRHNGAAHGGFLQSLLGLLEDSGRRFVSWVKGE